MTARSPNAYLMSGLLHACVALLAIFLAFGIGSPAPEAPKVFELVAGAGDNYAATAAPALGVPGGIRLHVPAMPAAPAVQEPPTPVQPAPLPAKTLKASLDKAPSAPRPGAVPDFKKVVERTESRRAARLEARYRRQLAEEEKREEREEKAAAARAARAQRIDAEGIREGVVGGSVENKTGGAGGKALTREEGELLDGYFALLKARIKENYEPTGDATDRMTARLEFYVAADGALSRVRIARSSGNADFDNSVLDAFRRTSSIGPRPDGKGETVTMEFNLREDESN